MKKRNVWIAALSALLVLALGIGLWSGGVFAPKEAKLSVPAERRTLPADPSAPEAEASESADALPLAATASEQKPWTPPIQNLVTESIGAPSEEIPAEQLITEPADVTNPEILEDETVTYDGEHFLVKLVPESDGTVTPALAAAGVTALEPMMRLDNGAWFLAYVGEGDVNAVVEAARGAEGVLVAEYDFASQTMADMPMAESVVDCVRDNPRVMEAWHLRACGIQEAWQYQAQNDLPVAGAGTIVAVIDTGVDYTHKELAASMWQNPNEIPDNNIDDDGNGYTDDYYGVDVITGKGSGNDDHGHGTHVAGIIAAANNREGTVGVAYNAKIMNVKAGQSSGYFLQSDIAKAIVYAFENGADVINMSFGGTTSSLAVQDALATAYTHCVLVAAAGNDGSYNEGQGSKPNYPAAFPYVLGVMSVNQNGVESGFTNWDLIRFSGVEYEVYAPGGQILSTIPGDRYAVWSGTSMASPVVASVAAMLRADLPDLGSYPTKYIYGQIAGTGTFIPACCDPEHHGPHNLPPVCDAIAALTVMPHPELGVSDYLIYDTEGFAAQNDGDGVIDAGETVALGFTLRNRWGMSKDTMVTVDALSPAGIPCPYVTFSTAPDGAGETSATVNYGGVGTYSEKNCGVVYNDAGTAIGWENPFYLHVDPDCPNDYIITLNISGTAGNALDETDTSAYTFAGTINLMVRRGVLLPHIVDSDMTLTADNFYILPYSMLINTGATLTVEPGTQIQFWSPNPVDGTEPKDSKIVCVGTLRMLGTEEQPIKLFPSELYHNYQVIITDSNGSGSSGANGTVIMQYCDVINPSIQVTTLDHCSLESNGMRGVNDHYDGRTYHCEVNCSYAKDTLFRGVWIDYGIRCDKCAFKNCTFLDDTGNDRVAQPVRDSLILNDAEFYYLNGSTRRANGNDYIRCDDNPSAIGSWNFTPIAVYYNEETDTNYFSINMWQYYGTYMSDIAERASVLADDLGGNVLRVETPEELAFLNEAGAFGTGDTQREEYAVLAEHDAQEQAAYWLLRSEQSNITGVKFVNERGDRIGDFLTLDNETTTNPVPYGFLNSDGQLRFVDYSNSGGGVGPVDFVIEFPDCGGALTLEDIQSRMDEIPLTKKDLSFYGNAILNPVNTVDSVNWTKIRAYKSRNYSKSPLCGNFWGTTDLNLIERMITDFEDDVQYADLDPSGFLTEAPENVWPFVSDVEILNQAGEQVTTVGNEPLTFRVHFNRDMDTSIELSVRFGSYYPYADYEIEGSYTDARTWEGSTTLTTLIENGTQVLRIQNGKAADEAKELLDDFGRFTFTIDTTAAQAMIMQGAADDNGILLTWYQDDFDTLAGYNVYRSTSEDGFYQRLNSAVIPADVKEFYDDTVEPGKVYYYNFTVVKTDLTESTPSGKVTIMSKDTMAPVMYHTPVYQAFAGQKVVVSATVTDNVAVQSVKLYFRQTGETEWNVMEMTKLNDKYYANISAAFVTMQGLEYYIEAFDGVQRVYRGTAEAPYAVTVQEAVDLTDKGDVNGDGRITNLDALMLLQAVNDRLNLDAAQFARADINDNGELEAVEALRILHYVSGKVTSILF